ncbi:hypothetical protein QIS99_13910 [Streptomyces sp. B-S-A8]|uniref:YCII-related domain-containing protein n=1 Tax=Streptomyces solicavernae TaxID=3043614 RepID=A0ABT6RS96_9ACTN|nr:hypothetical protein [Streptomyces sp. B-S-A8]MDI3387289.1 hypothetical protein [Streptomyces sp. B-S-A8]
MRTWEFTLIMNRGLTDEEEHAWNYWPEADDLLVDGSIGQTKGPPGTSKMESMCFIEASSLLEAVSIATQEIRKVADVYPVCIEVDEEHRRDLEGLARVA